MSKIIIILFLLFTSLNAVVVTDYRMDECYWLDNAGGVVDDVKEELNGLDGTSHSNAQTFDIIGVAPKPMCRGANFQSGGDYVDVNNDPLLNTTSNFSLSAWVRPNNFSATFEVIANKTTNYSNGFTFYTYFGGGVGYIILQIGNGSSNRNVFYQPITPNQWIHVVATYNGSIMRLYLNGTQVSTRNYTGGIANANRPLIIGRGLGTSYQYTGDLDEFKLYNHTLTAGEVTTIYNNENAGNNYDGSPRVCKTCNATATAGIWGLIGIPADFRTAANKDVANVFEEFPAVDYNIPANPNGWVVFKRNYSATDNSSSYSVVPYTGTPLEFGQGYWLATQSTVNWSENTLPSVDYNSAHAACTSATCVEIDLTSVTKNFGAPDNDPNDHSGRNRNNMLGFIGQTPVNWADCRILVDGVAYTPSAAATAGYADKQVWQYNPGIGGANANGYTTCDDTSPGGCKLEPYKGFWVILHGITKNKTVKLLIPKE